MEKFYMPLQSAPLRVIIGPVLLYISGALTPISGIVLAASDAHEDEIDIARAQRMLIIPG